MPNRVVITGIGAVSPVGLDASSTWAALISGKSGIGRISLFDPSDQEVTIAAEVKDFDPTVALDRKEVRRNDRFVQFAVAAAKEAIDRSRLVDRREQS